MNEVAAYHEAGHAVVGHVLKLGIEKATIIESEGVAGQVDLADAPDPDDEHLYRDYLRRRLACTIGGPWAEALYLEEEVEFTPFYFYGDDWEELIDDAAALAGEDAEEQERVRDEAALKAHRILTENWSKVEAIAKALMQHGELSRVQLLPLLPQA